jgi:cholesterol transport system auxiliary component
MTLSRRRGLARAAALSLIAIGLTGCISLLPKEKPSQLYRFGVDVAAPAAAPSTNERFTVRAAPLSFERAAAGDRILTVSGDQVAYVGAARWVSTAASLFESAESSAFNMLAGQSRLLAPGEPAAGDYVLKVDVRSFEARYDHGTNAAPEIVVEVYAALADRKDPRLGGNRLFRAVEPTGSNSVHAIASAFDKAVAAVLKDLVAWVDAKGAA